MCHRFTHELVQQRIFIETERPVLDSLLVFSLRDRVKTHIVDRVEWDQKGPGKKKPRIGGLLVIA